jgi:hypothetical protein
MLYNSTYTTYRRQAVSGKRSYDASATITGGLGFKTPLDGKLKSTLGVDDSVDVFHLLTELTDFQRHDKVTISSVDYFVESIESIDTGAQILTRLLIQTKLDD